MKLASASFQRADRETNMALVFEGIGRISTERMCPDFSCGGGHVTIATQEGAMLRIGRPKREERK